MSNRREFIKKTSGLLASAVVLSPSALLTSFKSQNLRTAHIGVGGMGMEDLKAIASHNAVQVTALCDVDSRALKAASELFPNAKTYTDYRIMLRELDQSIDAVVVSTPDHTHAPASMLAMEKEKAVYCQKPLTHHVTEARAMNKKAKEKNLVTQMGIQVHSFYDYKLATQLIQAGVIGKVSKVIAWSQSMWGYDGPVPEGKDPVPEYLDWNLWLGTAKDRDYKEGYYHPANWRKLVDYGCGTLGDMGVHIFDTPYNALSLDIPYTIKNECREPNGYGFPETNVVTYEFPGTKYTTEKIQWIWYDGIGAPAAQKDLELPDPKETLHDQGAMFVGEKGRLFLPHFMELPRLIIDGKYQELDYSIIEESIRPKGVPVRNYDEESKEHYHQFVDACLGNGKCTAPFSYAARLTETILLGVIAGYFPNQKLHWNSETSRFDEEAANKYLDAPYREF
ncbi:MAG: Gfo/Idh/MocA family oxidoreductase [Flavobacteriaceae bacterium]|nr:Gfo/Idh/MocA family oxidoreductase [Flavobacteriaceae bacterium]